MILIIHIPIANNREYWIKYDILDAKYKTKCKYEKMNKQYNLHITVGDWSPANIPIYNIEQNIRSDAKYNIRCKI